MPSIPNFLHGQTPLGQAFGNLANALMSGPTDAQKYLQADSAVLAHRKVQGQEGLANRFQQLYAPAQQAPVSEAGPAPAGGPSGPMPAMPQLGTASGDVAASPIGRAFRDTAPAPAPSAPASSAAPSGSPDWGGFLHDAIYAGMDPKHLGGYNLFGAANQYGAADRRTQSAQVGEGQTYENTYNALDRKQTDEMTRADNTNATSRANNADTNAAENERARLQRATQENIANLHEQGEDRRAEMKGNKADQKQQAQDAARLTTADVVMGKVDEALKHVGLFTTGVVGSQTSKVPGGEAYTLARDIDTIKSNLGFDTLAAMRAASPTGGALGAVSDFENKMLQSTVSSLDQGLNPTELRKNLEQVKQHYQNVRDLINGKMPKGAGPQPNTPAAAPAASGWTVERQQ